MTPASEEPFPRDSAFFQTEFWWSVREDWLFNLLEEKLAPNPSDEGFSPRRSYPAEPLSFFL